MIKYEKAVNIDKLVTLSSQIWHEYWKEYLSDAQIDYMVEKFQSLDAMTNQIETQKYSYLAVYDDEDSVKNIKVLFESSWNLANDLDINALVEKK
jgi:DNA-binding SARP family transcriptional activator